MSPESDGTWVMRGSPVWFPENDPRNHDPGCRQRDDDERTLGRGPEKIPLIIERSRRWSVPRYAVAHRDRDVEPAWSTHLHLHAAAEPAAGWSAKSSAIVIANTTLCGLNRARWPPSELPSGLQSRSRDSRDGHDPRKATSATREQARSRPPEARLRDIAVALSWKTTLLERAIATAARPPSDVLGWPQREREHDLQVIAPTNAQPTAWPSAKPGRTSCSTTSPSATIRPGCTRGIATAGYDGHPDRTQEEIGARAPEHDVPYFDSEALP